MGNAALASETKFAACEAAGAGSAEASGGVAGHYTAACELGAGAALSC